MKKIFIPLLLLFSLLATPAFPYGGVRTYPIDADNVVIQKASNPSMWQGYEFGRPTGAARWFEDFFSITLAQWVVTETGAGTEAITDEANGVLLLTNAAADNDAISMQLGNTADGGTGESFLPADGRQIICEAKWKVSDATQSDVLIGLSVTDTTPLANANSVVFQKDDDATTLFFRTGPTATASSANLGAISTAYVTVGFKITGTNLVEYYLNDAKVSQFTSNIPTTEMRPTIHCQNGEAVAKTCSIDYFFCTETR